MALGVSSFTTQNNELPGAFNFVSAASESDVLPDRGIYESKIQGNVYYGGIMSHAELMEMKER